MRERASVVIVIAGAVSPLVAIRASHVSLASTHMTPTTAARRFDWVVESVLRGDEHLLPLFDSNNCNAEIVAEQ